jgi:hypothetical protein
MAPFLIQLLEDPYHAVRLIASRSLRKIPGFEEFHYDWKYTQGKLAEERRRGLEIWESMSKPPLPTSVLIDETSNKLQQERFSRLLQQRDDRPVYVAE